MFRFLLILSARINCYDSIIGRERVCACGSNIIAKFTGSIIIKFVKKKCDVEHVIIWQRSLATAKMN